MNGNNNIKDGAKHGVEPRPVQDDSVQGLVVVERRVAGIHRLTKYTVYYRNHVIERYVAEQYQGGWTAAGCHFYENKDGTINVKLFEKHLNGKGKETEQYTVKIANKKIDENNTVLSVTSVETDEYDELPSFHLEFFVSPEEVE